MRPKVGDTVLVRARVCEIAGSDARVYVINGGSLWAEMRDIIKQPSEAPESEMVEEK